MQLFLIFEIYLDVNTSVPDKKSVMMYVMCLFQRLSQYSDEMGVSKSDIQVRNKKKIMYI